MRWIKATADGLSPDDVFLLTKKSMLCHKVINCYRLNKQTVQVTDHLHNDMRLRPTQAVWVRSLN